MKILFIPLLSILAGTECANQYPSTYQSYSKLKHSTTILVKNNLFKVKNGNLDVVSKSGKTVRFINTISRNDESSENTYEYIGEAKKINSFFVQKTGYETGSVIMITKRGTKVDLWDIPSVSSNNTLAVSLSQSIDNEAIPNGIQIIYLENGEVKNKCDIIINHLEPQDLRWVDNKSFIVKFQKFDSDGVRINKFSYLEYRINSHE